MPQPPRVLGCFALGWLLLWTAGTLLADIQVGRTLFHQMRAATFPTADGVITRSEVKTTNEDGTTHRPDLAYTYTVAGQRYTGTRYSSSEVGTNTQAWHKIRDELPVGSRVRVAYNPTDPAESLLRPGFTGFDLMWVWFFTPFNVVMIGGWVYYASLHRPAFGPASLTRTATGWRARLPGLGRVGTFGVVLLAVTFVGNFVWMCGCGFNPPVEFAGPGYGAAIACAVLVARRARPWLVVDEVARVLRLPAELPFDAIRDVIVTHEEKRDSEGDVTQHYHCDLIRSDAPVVRVATYSEPEPANALATWLRERVGIAPTTG